VKAHEPRPEADALAGDIPDRFQVRLVVAGGLDELLMLLEQPVLLGRICRGEDLVGGGRGRFHPGEAPHPLPVPLHQAAEYREHYKASALESHATRD